jgi:hypothetical protein
MLGRILGLPALFGFFVVCVLWKCTAHAETYSVHKGFHSSCAFSPSLVMESLKKNTTYGCKGSAGLVQYHMQNEQELTFDKDRFLSMLQNKTLGIIGDSVALQNFLALEEELLCEETWKHDGNGKETSMVLMTSSGKNWKSKSHFPHYIAAKRKYDKYQATIIWCVDQMLSTATNKIWFEFCGKQVIMSDVIVIGIGAFYKPLYLNKSDTQTLDIYRESMKNASDFLLNSIYPFREMIKKLNPTATVIWRDYSHVGNHVSSWCLPF